MVKIDTSPKKSLYGRFFIPLLLAAAVSGSGLWLWNNDKFSDWKNHLYSYVENQDIVTLESKYTPQQIIETHRLDLTSNDEKKVIQEPIFEYYPYLLLNVKYTEDKKTREGVLLWGLTNGEIVLNTQTWETTRGFKDCLDCQATRQDFKIIQTLAHHQGTLPLEELQKELKLESQTLQPLIENAMQKHLIIQKGSTIQLHFENPKFLVLPQTQIKQKLVSKPILNEQKMGKTFSRSQILSLAQAAFGSDFTVRSEQEIFLPVYRLLVQNPDGTIYKTQWNALTGERFLPSSLPHAIGS